ncbi:hypothetical protein J560_4524, partial [Acinetobacter baumannii 855125]
MTSISLINFYSSGKLPASSLACFKARKKHSKKSKPIK